MTIDEYLLKPCGHCGQQRSRHIGKALGCFGGYGTTWNPGGKPDYRVIHGCVECKSEVPCCRHKGEK